MSTKPFAKRPSFKKLSVARCGKIARLPHEIREEINRRLRDGEKGPDMLKWLNSLPKVRAVLKSEFESRPLMPDNLSQWRKGGYRDWLARQDGLMMIQSLKEREKLAGRSLGKEFAEDLSNWGAMHHAACAHSLIAREADLVLRWKRLQEFTTSITRLSRAETFAEFAALDREKLAFKHPPEPPSDQGKSERI